MTLEGGSIPPIAPRKFMENETTINHAPPPNPSELLSLEVGEMIHFPIDKYKRDTLRVRPSQIKKLYPEAKDRVFVTREYDDSSTVITRFPNEEDIQK